jgi:UDP-N-acetylglucosamine 2-epimerase (non-hydrolysing)
MKKLRVMTVIGTRPEIIRLSAVIHKLEQSEAITHILVHTGQNYDYELNEVFFRDLNIRKPDYYLDVAAKSASDTIGNVIIRIDPILLEEKPDAILILGDTNSCLCAIAAKKRKIPVFHMEAGNRCFDQRVPEEINRRIVDHIADINMPYSSIAREYLLHEGIPADRIIKTGSPMYEVLENARDKVTKSDIVERLSLMKEKYFVVSAHREENVNNQNHFANLVESLNQIAETYQLPIILSTHPRTRAILDREKTELHPLIRSMKPFGFYDYLKLEMMAKATLSDSGTINEEASILRFCALNIRQAHERMEAMEEASVMMTGLKKDRIFQGLKILETQKPDTLRQVVDYSMPNVSDKVVRILLSYTDYIDRVVWYRN